jgi:hypothetical protein
LITSASRKEALISLSFITFGLMNKCTQIQLKKESSPIELLLNEISCKLQFFEFNKLK